MNYLFQEIKCQSILHFWAENEKNIKPSILSSEITLLYLWEFIRKHNLYDDNEVATAFHNAINTLYSAYHTYFNKVESKCYLPNGFYGYGKSPAQECINIFEHLGYLTTFGLLHVNMGIIEKNEQMIRDAKAVTDAIKNYITNHPSAKSPCYDDHIIEISHTIYLMIILGEIDFVRNWIADIIDNIGFSYFKLGKYFPISSDSFEDLIELCMSDSIPKEDLFELSTLVPILASWCVCLNLNEEFGVIQRTIKEILPKCDYQIWHPDVETEKYLYTQNAARISGAIESSIRLEDTFENLKSMLFKTKARSEEVNNLSCFTNQLNVIATISSRHFRTPPFPIYWLQLLSEENVERLDNINENQV